MTAPSPPLISRYHMDILGLQPRDKAAMLGRTVKQARKVVSASQCSSKSRPPTQVLKTLEASVLKPGVWEQRNAHQK